MSNWTQNIPTAEQQGAGDSRTHPAALVAALGLHIAVAAAALLFARPAPPNPAAPVLDLRLAFPAPPAAETTPTEAEPHDAPPAPDLLPAPEPPAEPAPVPEPPAEPSSVPPEPAMAETPPSPEPPPAEPPPPKASPDMPAALPPPPQSQPRPTVRPRQQVQRPATQPRQLPAEAGAPPRAAMAAPPSAPPAAEPATATDALGEYRAALLRILRANHRYPRAAEARGEEGTVLVRFVVARDGRLLSPRIERGSGYPALDDEAAALLRRISPLPPLPAAASLPQIEIVLPIAFRLR